MYSAFPMVVALAGAALLAATPAAAQDAGEGYVRVAAARSRFVDKGGVSLNGAAVPGAGYGTRAIDHGVLTGGYFLADGVAAEASVSTPATTPIKAAGPLAGLTSLGAETATILTVGAAIQPFHGPVSPFVGAGYERLIAVKRRGALLLDLRVPDGGGAYVQAGVDVALAPTWGAFASVRKAWTGSRATGLLPLDASYTHFAPVAADARFDPVTVQLGVTARFGGPAGSGGPAAIGTDTTRWTIRLGAASMSLADKVKLDLEGARYPGAALSTSAKVAPLVEIGRFLTPHIALNLTAGIPPSIGIHAGGSIGGLSKVGDATYGAVVLTAQYHFTRRGRVRPYVGAGGSYLIVFGTSDGAFKDLRIDNAFGWAFEAGSDVMVSNRVGLFAEAKKALLRPTAYGRYLGLAVEARTRLDPWAFGGGLALHL